MPEQVKALLIILIKDPLSIPISLPQVHCIFWSRAVKLYFLAILALWQRKTSPGPILSYFQSLFLQAAHRITSTFFPGRVDSPGCAQVLKEFSGLAHFYSGITLQYTAAQKPVKRPFCKMVHVNMDNCRYLTVYIFWWPLYIMPYCIRKINCLVSGIDRRLEWGTDRNGTLGSF